MKNKKLILIGVVVCLIAAVWFAFFRKDDTILETPTNSDSTQISNSEVQSPDENIENNETEDNTVLLAPTSRSFKALYTDVGKTMVGTAEYMNLDFFKTRGQDFIESLELKPIMVGENEEDVYKLSTGNTVYRSSIDNKDYIISGYNTLFVKDGNIHEMGFVREEETGHLIKIAISSGEKETLLNRWEEGQKILNGEIFPEVGTIVLDGFLSNEHYVVGEDGEFYFNLEKVSMELCPVTVVAEDKGYLIVSPNEFIAVTIPTDAAISRIKETFSIIDGQFQFKSWYGDEKFTLTVPVLDHETMLISAKNASRMFGWRMYSDGVTLSIVTDPVNNKGLVEVYAANAKGSVYTKLETLEDGKRYMNTYDSGGNLISSIPFDEEKYQRDLKENLENTESN